MHNLLLGTARHMLSVWKSRGILDESHFQSIEDKVASFVTPNTWVVSQQRLHLVLLVYQLNNSEIGHCFIPILSDSTTS